LKSHQPSADGRQLVIAPTHGLGVFAPLRETRVRGQRNQVAAKQVSGDKTKPTFAATSEQKSLQ
jgi:hypothetical protein